MKMPAEKMNEMLGLYKAYMEIRKDTFFDYVLFSYQWWFLLFTIIGLWGLWVMMVDKKRILPILLVGLLTSVIAIILDDIGLNLMLWGYPYWLTPFTSRMDPVNIAIIPVSYMLVYQYMKTWKTYVIMLVLASLFGVLIAEPIFVKLKLYLMLQWTYWYSMPFYIAIGVFAKWFVDKLKRNSA